MSDYAPGRIVMVTGANNTKGYEMAENGDGTFTARFGRIGSRLQETTYPVSRWDATYRAKTRQATRTSRPSRPRKWRKASRSPRPPSPR